jgi:threonine aldolase
MVLPCHTTALEIEKVLVTDDDVHHAPTKLLCLENTLNGTILPFEELKKISQLAKKHKIPIHLDGARLWNATAATGISIKEYAQYVDSISLCFSKGLGCPIGSILVGSLSFIKRATHLRKLYGGGWRQAGYLAGACRYSMENILPNLHRDHEIAQTLKKGLQKLGYSLLYPVETNMVWIDGSQLSSKDIVQHFRSRGIIVSAPDEKTGAWRLVTHHQISEENVLNFLDCLEEITEKENI